MKRFSFALRLFSGAIVALVALVFFRHRSNAPYNAGFQAV